MASAVVKTVLSRNPDIPIDFVHVVTWCVHCAEIVSAQRKVKPDSESKLQLFRSLVPLFLQEAVVQQLCTAATAAELQTRFDADWTAAESLVDVLVQVAHNPAFVQLEDEVATACCHGKPA